VGYAPPLCLPGVSKLLVRCEKDLFSLDIYRSIVVDSRHNYKSQSVFTLGLHCRFETYHQVGEVVIGYHPNKAIG
jgi:hypothetical protein